MKKVQLMLFCTILLAGVAGTSIALPLVNGDFDSVLNHSPNRGIVNGIQLNEMKRGQWDVYDSIDGWVSGENDSGVEIQYSTVVNAHSPNFYVELDSHPSPHSNSSITQTVFLDAGTYELSFWYMPRTNTPNDNGIDFSIGNTDLLLNGTVDGTRNQFPGWQEFNYLFNVQTAANYELTFAATGLENTLGGFLDDVSVTPTPEPATMLLLGCGLIGFAAVGRKHFKK